MPSGLIRIPNIPRCTHTYC